MGDGVRGMQDRVQHVPRHLPADWRKVERVTVAERPVELRLERMEDNVDLVDDGDRSLPNL